MQIAVCDDEPNVRILIKNMIMTSEPNAEITEFDDGQELEKSDVFQYDIIFMDVEMNHQSGVKTARNIREKQQKKNIIHLKDEELAYYGLISDLENELSKDFFRIHKGYLVNMKYVDRYNRTQVFLRSGESLLLSKYRYADFVSAYMESLKDS